MQQFTRHEPVGDLVPPMEVLDLRRHLRLSLTSKKEDPDLELYLEGATDYMETALGRSLMSRQWRLVLDAFPMTAGKDPWWNGVRQGAMNMFDRYSPVDLPRGPVKSVESLTTYSYGGASSVFPDTRYAVDYSQNQVRLQAGWTWPSGLRPHEAVEILYTAGYGDDPLSVPAAIRVGILQLAGHWYENRVPVLQGSGVSTTEVPLLVSNVISRYRMRRL